MAGSLTLGGMSDGLLSGQSTFGPNTVNGKRAIGETLEVTLEANVDYTVKIPSEAVQWAAFFPFTGSIAAEVKVGSNLVATASGMPVLAQGHVSVPLASAITELKLKSASPPPAFQLVFV